MPTRLDGVFVLYLFDEHATFPNLSLSIRIPIDAYQTLMPSRGEIEKFTAWVVQSEHDVSGLIQEKLNLPSTSMDEMERAMYLDAACRSYIFIRPLFGPSFDQKSDAEKIAVYRELNNRARLVALEWLRRYPASQPARSIAREGFFAPPLMHQAFLCEMWPEIAQWLGKQSRLPSHSDVRPTNQ